MTFCYCHRSTFAGMWRQNAAASRRDPEVAGITGCSIGMLEHCKPLQGCCQEKYTCSMPTTTVEIEAVNLGDVKLSLEFKKDMLRWLLWCSHFFVLQANAASTFNILNQEGRAVVGAFLPSE